MKLCFRSSKNINSIMETLKASSFMADEYDQSLNHTQEFNLQEGDKVYMAKEVTMCYHMAIKTILADSHYVIFSLTNKISHKLLEID